VVYDLVKGIDKEKFAPEILVKHTKGDFYKEVEKLGVPIHKFPYETNYYPIWSFPFRLMKVIRFFKKLEVDIIHSWHYSSDFSEVLAARLAGIKFVYTKKAMGWGNKAWRWKSKLSHQVIAINKDMMTEFFSTHFTISAVYLPLGLDVDFYSHKSYHRPTASQYSISKSDFVIISVVNMIEVKGIEVLIEAFIKSKIQNGKLLLVGGDNNNYALKLKEKYVSSFPEIIFTGKQLEVKNYLSIADVFVIPTKNEGKREGMPMAPVEAMSMGVPVIGSKVSGINDILEGFEECLFEAGNVDELTANLQEIYKLSRLNRENLGGEMRKKVKKKYSLKNVISAHEKIYEQL
jgi:glycosyltransferase involved in cell wall biosynthesis